MWPNIAALGLVAGSGGQASGWRTDEPKPWVSTPDCPAPPGAVSYSQSYEDVDLHNYYFCGHLDGTFIEIGALDGVRQSNTKFFEDKMGWAGGLIEASPASAERLLRNRRSRRNRIFAEGVCREGQGQMSFLLGEEPATSGNPDTMAAKFKARWHGGGRSSQSMQVPCRPLAPMLAEVLRHTGRGRIDLISLDVEGGELVALETMNWSVPVHVWIVEMDGLNPTKDDAVRSLLLANGYSKSRHPFDPRNEVFVLTAWTEEQSVSHLTDLLATSNANWLLALAVVAGAAASQAAVGTRPCTAALLLPLALAMLPPQLDWSGQGMQMLSTDRSAKMG